MDGSTEKKIDIKKQYSGTTYQIKVLLLLLCLGRKAKNYDHFYLRTEVKDAEKFDDAVFYYKRKDETVYNVRYFQIKSSESENAELKYTDFVSNFDKAVANILKYFISYRKIKMKTAKENVEDFILCTNYKLPLKLKKSEANDDEILLFREDSTPDELFGILSYQWKKYKITKISGELQKNLLKSSNLDLLAEELIECITKSKNNKSSTVSIDLNSFWLSKYQHALKLEKVIVKKTITAPNGKTVVSKKDDYVFSDEFLNKKNISKECEDFRNIFLDLCEAKFMNLFLCEKLYSVDNSFKNFHIGKNNIQEHRSDETLNKDDVFYLEQCATNFGYSAYYETVFKTDIIGQHKPLSGIFKPVGKNIVKFTGDFVQNKNLTNAAKVFRKHFLRFYATMVLKDMKLELIKNKCVKGFAEENTPCYDKLINNKDIDNEIEQFLEKFSIQTMPHDNELMDVIKNEISDEFNLLEDKWITNSLLQKVGKWFKTAEEVPLDKTEVDKYFEEIIKDVVIEMSEGNFYTEMLQTYNLSFETVPETWKDFLEPIKKDDTETNIHTSSFLMLLTDEPILTAMKIQTAMRSFDFYKKQKSFIMYPASVLLQMELKTNFLNNALKSETCYNAIVIVADEKEATLALFMYLRTCTKKVVLITSEKMSIFDYIKRNCEFYEEKDHFNFNDLTSASQEFVLEKEIIFQGINVPLRRVIDKAYNLIGSKTVMELATNNSTFEIGKMLEPYKEYHRNSYIDRKIGLIEIKNDFFSKSFPGCLFLIEAKNITEAREFLKHKNIDENKISVHKWNSHSSFIIAKVNNVAKMFHRLLKNNANLCIYWFRLWKEKLLWFHCSASAFDKTTRESPMSCTKVYPEDENAALEFLSTSETIIITDSPGMGKSTILTSLSLRIPSNVLKWKIRIDFKKYTKYFLELKEAKPKTGADYLDIEKYVMDKIFNRISQNDDKKPYEFCVFDEMFRQNKVLLIFDGFDEISPNYENIALEMFKNIRKSTQNQLWVTSRLNMKQTLEQELKAFSLSIMPFTIDDQNNYLKNLWKKNWESEWDQNYEHHIEIYAEYLITEFNKMTKRNDTDIIGIPLQTKMLGEVFQENNEEDNDWQSCYKFLEDAHKCDLLLCHCFPSTGNKLQNIYVLYEAFVRKYLTRHLNEKEEIDASKIGSSQTETLYFNEIHKVHKVLGIFALVDNTKNCKVLVEAESEIKTFLIQQIPIARFGLISEVSDDKKPIFTHLTFAEYFSANYLIEKLISHPFEVFETIETILQSDVPVFLYCIKYLIKTKISDVELEDTTVINFLSKHNFSNCFKYFSMDDIYEDVFPHIDKYGKTPLHYAVEFDHLKCVIFILLQKFNRFFKCEYDTGRENRKINYTQKELIYIEKESIFFLLQAFITLPDIHGKSALDYSTNPQITDILNDFIKVGKNNLIPKKKIRDALYDIQWIHSEFDFIKMVEDRLLFVIDFPLKDIFYRCSLNTIFMILDNCKNLLSNDNKFKSENAEIITENICSSHDICEEEKITFFNTSFARSSTDLKSILRSSILCDNMKVFRFFFHQINDKIDYRTKFYHCLDIACSAKNSKAVNVMFENAKERETLDLLECLFPVKTNVDILKIIFAQFNGDQNMEQKYATKILLLNLDSTFQEVRTKYYLSKGENASGVNVKYLLSKGAKINVLHRSGRNAWDYAIELSQTQIIKAMTPYVVNPKVRNILQKLFNDETKNQVFKFFEAFELNDENLCAFIVRKSSNVNIKDVNGKSPLCYACEKGWKKVVELLLKSGACYEDVYDENGKLFDYCLKNDEIVTLLKITKCCFENSKSFVYLHMYKESGISLKTVNNKKKPLWYISLKHGIQIGCVLSKVFDHGTINSQDTDGNTALHFAAKGGFVEIVEVLLRKGAVYNIKNNKNQTPQDLAKEYDIRLLLTKCELSFMAVKGKTLHASKSLLSVRYNYERFMSVRNTFGRTPVFYAIRNNDIKTVKLFFEEGGHWKWRYGKKNQCTQFISLMNALFNDLYNLNVNSFMEKINKFCAKPIPGFNVYDIMNVKNDVGETLFEHVLQHMNDYDLCVFLLERGAAIIEDYVGMNRRISKIFAFINKIFKSVKLDAFKTFSIIRLIEENKCTKILTKVRNGFYKETLLHTSINANNFIMAEWLIKNGADFSAEDCYGKTALQIALGNFNKTVIKSFKSQKKKFYIYLLNYFLRIKDTLELCPVLRDLETTGPNDVLPVTRKSTKINSFFYKTPPKCSTLHKHFKYKASKPFKDNFRR